MEDVKKISVSLDQDTRETIAKLAQEKRQNFSAALRLIVSDWRDAKQKQNGKQETPCSN